VDDKKRRALIKTLNDPKNFESNYLEPNRLWFLEKVIRALESEGLGDSAVEQKSREVLQKAKALVKANRDFTISIAANGNKRFTTKALASMRKHRVEILYGAIAFNRQFVEPQHLNYLLFIARRRFHGICRMFFWVNPNRQGYFRYPHRCSTNRDWRVNEDASQFWERMNPPQDIPIKLKPQGASGVDPVGALNELFITKSDACKGNLLDCSTVAAIVFMDTFMEARNPDQYLRKLASKGAGYLIIHQLGHAGSANFDQDTTDEGPMRIVARPARDLQVGDHVYIFNHPLYKTFRPTGSWRGEHSLVYISGDRNHRSREGFVFGGHGKEGTLFQFYDAFLSELKSHLSMARQLMLAHLAFMGGRAGATAPVKDQVRNIGILNAPAVPYRLLEYERNVAARDFTKVPTRTNKKPKISLPAFVVVQSRTENVFYLEQVADPDEDKPLSSNLKKRISEVDPPGKLTYPIKFRRTSAPLSGAAPSVIYQFESWAVSYFDRSTNRDEDWTFFDVKGGRLTPKELTHDDLFKSPFTLFTKAGTDLSVRQPKVDFGAGHRSFLTANGAL
jgi:hypothetical protein